VPKDDKTNWRQAADKTNWREAAQEAAQAYGLNPQVVEDEVERQLTQKFAERIAERIVKKATAGKVGAVG